MDEVIPTLKSLPDISFSDYKKILIERFSNTKIRDQLPRLCLHSSAKLPKWVLGSLQDKLEQGGPIDYLSLTIAAWFRYLNGKDDRGNALIIDDPMADMLTGKARAGGADPAQLLGLTEIFGDLPQSKPFVETVTRYLQQLYDQGTQKVLTELLSKRNA